MRLFFIALLALAQQPQQMTSGSIQGSVIQAGSPDSKLAGMTVDLRHEGAAGPFLTTITDAEGKFIFPNLTPGPYRMTASGGGFVRTEYGQRRANGPGLPVSLSANQRVADATIAMQPTGTISGRISDVSGQPIVLADVFALKSTYQEGRRIFTQMLSAKTDDRGEYRIFWMTPGLYYVDVIVPDGTNVSNLIMNADGQDTQATMNANRSLVRDVLSRPIGTGAGPNEAHVPVYYPTTTDPQSARVIDVRPGSDIRGVDITAIRVITRTIRGNVSNGVTRQPPGVGSQVQMVLAPTNPAQQPTQGTVDAATGKFEVQRVIPGTYVLYTRMRGTPGDTPTADILWGSLPLEIRERDVNDISLAAVPGIPLPGRVVVEDKTGAAAPSTAGLFIGMRPDPLLTQTVPSPSTTVAADGSFVLPPILAGKYRVYVIPMLVPNNPQLVAGAPQMPPGLQGLNIYVKSIRVGNTEVLDTGINLASPAEGTSIDILLGTNPGALEGRVLNDKRQPVDGAIVGLLPAAISARGFRTDMYKTASTDASGRFQVQSLPPGDYKVFAWEDIDKSALIDMDFMRLYESAGATIRINEGEKPNVEVIVIPPKQD